MRIPRNRGLGLAVVVIIVRHVSIVVVVCIFLYRIWSEPEGASQKPLEMLVVLVVKSVLGQRPLGPLLAAQPATPR